MHIRNFFVASFLSEAVALYTSPSHVFHKRQATGPCGAGLPSSRTQETMAAMRESEATSRVGTASQTSIEVTVNIHAALPSNATDDHLTIATLEEQFEVLSQGFAPYGIHMTLGGISREYNDSISRFTGMRLTNDSVELLGADPAIEDFWKRTRTGDYKTAHLYVYEAIDPEFVGLCTFPEQDRPESEFWLDACHVIRGSLPGGDYVPYNHGKTAIHEFGHWFGLWHVFTDFCDGDAQGDFIDDTPAQMPNLECPAEIDSCPDLPGLDSLSNYMDYTGDDCWEEFTPGQVARMHNLWGLRNL